MAFSVNHQNKFTVVLLGSQQDLKSTVGRALLKDNVDERKKGICERRENKDIAIINTPSSLNANDVSDLMCLSAPGPHAFLLVLAEGEQLEGELNSWQKHFPNLNHYTIAIMNKKKDSKMAAKCLDIHDSGLQESCKKTWKKLINHPYYYCKRVEFENERTGTKMQRHDDSVSKDCDREATQGDPVSPPIYLMGETGSGKNCFGSTIAGPRGLRTTATAASIITQRRQFTSSYGTEFSGTNTPNVSQYEATHARPVIICLLGETGSGKSASGNTILGSEKFLSKASAATVTTQCQLQSTFIHGTDIRVIDTPDFFDEDLQQPTRHILEFRKMCEGSACVYLLVIQIGRFTEGERGILERLEKTLQSSIRGNTIILFTRGDDLKSDQSIEDYVRNTNPHLRRLISICGDRYQVFNNKDRDGCSRQVEELLRIITRLLAYYK